MAKEKKGKPPEMGEKSPFQKFEQLAKKIVGVRKDIAKKSAKEQSV